MPDLPIVPFFNETKMVDEVQQIRKGEIVATAIVMIIAAIISYFNASFIPLLISVGICATTLAVYEYTLRSSR